MNKQEKQLTAGINRNHIPEGGNKPGYVFRGFPEDSKANQEQIASLEAQIAQLMQQRESEFQSALEIIRAEKQSRAEAMAAMHNMEQDIDMYTSAAYQDLLFIRRLLTAGFAKTKFEHGLINRLVLRTLNRIKDQLQELNKKHSDDGEASF